MARVRTPSISDSGPVRIRVETDTNSGNKVDAFTYFEDGTGSAGAIGTVTWVEMVGNYWSSSREWGTGSISFIEPTDIHYWELITDTMDSCQSYTWSTAKETNPLELETEQIQIDSGAARIALELDDTSMSYAAELNPGDYTNNGWYDLSALEDGPLEGMEIANFVRLSDSFTVQQPAIEGNSPPNIQRNQTIRWSGANADWILIEMAVMDSTGSAIQDLIQCVATDDGVFSVDGSLFSSWPNNRQVNVYVAAVVEETSVLPFNNAESRITGTYILMGAGFSQ